MLARMRTRATAAALILTACAGTPPADAPPAPTALASAAPTATASAAASGAPAPVDEAPSPFFPWVVNGYTLAYHPLEHGAALVSGNGVYQPHVYLVSEAGIQEDPRFLQGIKGVGDTNARLVMSVSGDWPRAAEMTVNTPGDRGGDDTNYNWNGSAWIQSRIQRFHGMPNEVVSAIYQGGYRGGASFNGRGFWYLHTDDVHFIAEGKGKGPTPAKGSGQCAHQLQGYAALFNDKAGDLVGVGKLCAEGDSADFWGFAGPGALAVERWKKGAARSTVVTLPGSAGKGMLGYGGAKVVEVSPTQHYIAASFSGQGDARDAYVAAWDGHAYQDISPPTGEDITRLWFEKDGALWAQRSTHLLRRRGDAWEALAPPGGKAEIADEWRAPDGTRWYRFGEALWHLGAGGSWEKAVLPKAEDGKRYVAQRLAWMGDEMLIVAARDASPDNVLLSSKKHDKVVDLGADVPLEARKPDAKRRAFGRVGPPVAGCQSLFVVLYKLSRVAPKDFDFPLTREALKGHTEYEGVRFAETEDAGSRYFVAFVPDLGKGRGLVKLVGEKVAGSKPQLLCGEPPQVNRKIEIDLRTGAIKK